MKKEKFQQKETETTDKEKATEPVRKRGRLRKIAEDNPPEDVGGNLGNLGDITAGKDWT